MSKSLGFAATFVVLFVLAYIFMAAADALPEPIGSVASESDAQSQTVQVNTDQTVQTSTTGELPVRVAAKKIGLDVSVSNTDSTDVDTLDSLLLKGSVRYPTSAALGEQGTVLLFGHSSYLPIVHNQNYKAFDGIQNLKTGDTVSVYSGSTRYDYAVVGVRLANATEDVVELPSNGQHLALVTCDSFGTKSSRYVVTADFVSSSSL